MVIENNSRPTALMGDVRFFLVRQVCCLENGSDELVDVGQSAELVPADTSLLTQAVHPQEICRDRHWFEQHTEDSSTSVSAVPGLAESFHMV